MNVRFIRRLSGVLRGFLNFLKRLFEMLEGPLLLFFFSVLMYVIISSSEVKSNLNDFSIGFVRNSSYVLCVGIIHFSICFGILQKKWLNVFAIDESSSDVTNTGKIRAGNKLRGAVK